MKETRRGDVIKNTFWEWLKKEKSTIHHPNQIPEWFLKNQRTIMDAHNAGVRPKHYNSFDSDKFFDTDNFEKLIFDRAPVFQDLLSNSHVCPDDGETNWGNVKTKVSGYPGWKTYIRGSHIRDKKHNSSYPYGYALKLVGLKTGTGGGGNENWGYECSIFLADWPGLQVEYANILQRRYEAEQEAIINRLKGKR